MTDPLRLWLVEDDPAFRDSFGQLLATTDGFSLDGAFERFEDVPDGGPDPDLVVMDFQLPGLDGAAATRALRDRRPGLPVVVLTLVDRADAVFRALRAGASGYVIKGTPPEGIFRALREAHAGGTSFGPSVARYVLQFFRGEAPDDDPAEPLSPREIDVLGALADGLSKAGVADRLFLSPHTVDSHLRSVYAKLHVHTAAEAAAKGVRLGII